MTQTRITHRLGLRAGERVQVRSRDEILATLDADGRLDGMPFMPEMLAFCGKSLVVASRADKTCLHNKGFSLRRLKNAVHLETARCDGASHGGCQAACMIYWKEAWLTRDESATRAVSRPSAGTCTENRLISATRTSAPGADETYMCQATELTRFSSYIHWWDLRHFVRDLRSGHLRSGMARIRSERILEAALEVLHVLRAALIFSFNKVQDRRGCGAYPGVGGPLTKTPTTAATLRPGDLVQVKTKEEIIATLNGGSQNRGMGYDGEMLKFSGGMYRVLNRVDKIIDEKTGRLMNLTNDCLILDGVSCTGEYHGLCPRALYPYWREIWLNKVTPAANTDTRRDPVHEPLTQPTPELAGARR